MVNENFHVDLSLMVNFKDTPSVFYGRIGMAYRFDMHEEDEFIEEKGKTGREARKAEKDKNKALKKSKKREKKRRNKRRDDFEIEDGGGDGGL